MASLRVSIKKQVGDKRITLPHCHPSLKEARTGTLRDRNLEAGVGVEAVGKSIFLLAPYGCWPTWLSYET